MKMIKKNSLKEIGRRCYNIRADYKEDRIISQRDFAKELGISYSRVSDIENGNVEMTLRDLLAYQKVTGYSLDFIANETVCKNADNKEINKRLRFNDDTIKLFEDIDTEDIFIVNTIFGSKEISKYTKNLIKAYKEYVKSISNNHLEIDIDSFSKIDLQLEDDVEKINEFLKQKEYIYLFKISEIAKKIAKLLKKKYDESTNEVANSHTTGRKKK